jgi:hypothetical protein
MGWKRCAGIVAAALICCSPGPGEGDIHVIFIGSGREAIDHEIIRVVRLAGRADVDGDGIDEMLIRTSDGVDFAAVHGERRLLVPVPRVRWLQWTSTPDGRADLLLLDDEGLLSVAECAISDPPECVIRRTIDTVSGDGFVADDFNEDGLLDVVTVSFERELRLFGGVGSVEHTTPPDSAAELGTGQWMAEIRQHLAQADIDDDGHVDLALLEHEAIVFYGDGAGSFSEGARLTIPDDAYVRRVYLARMGDGLVHIVTDSVVFANLGGRQFEEAGEPVAGAVRLLVGDFAAEEGAEILCYPESSGDAMIILRTTDGEWATRPLDAPVDGGWQDLLVADLDGNGIDDVATLLLRYDGCG